jgi:hypothetical protein
MPFEISDSFYEYRVFPKLNPELMKLYGIVGNLEDMIGDGNRKIKSSVTSEKENF